MCGVKAFKSCSCVNFRLATTEPKKLFEAIGYNNADLNCVKELREQLFIDSEIDKGNFTFNITS
jgi:hypothetical protein